MIRTTAYTLTGNKSVVKYTLIIKNIEDQEQGKEVFQITKLHSFSTVHELKKCVQEKLNTSKNSFRIFYKLQELCNNKDQLHTYGMKTRSVLTIQIDKDLKASNGIIIEYDLFSAMSEISEHKQRLKPSSELNQIFLQIKQGFNKKITPKLSEDGLGGTYFLENDVRKIVAVFKPRDEEPFTPNNPKNNKAQFGTKGFKVGILSGEGALREVFAYFLDCLYDNYHGVPATTFIEFYHPEFYQNNLNQDQKTEIQNLKKSFSMNQHQIEKQLSQKIQKKQDYLDSIKYGSLQAFVEHDVTLENMGSEFFSDEQIHRIAILDIRILNCDRNGGNVLVKKHQKGKTKYYTLTPIDHGYSLPDPVEIISYEILWFNWPQIKKPFSQESLKLIESINPDEDAKILQEKLKIRPKCIRNFKMAEILLKKAAKAGLTMYDIAEIIYREDDDVESKFEQVIKKTEVMYQTRKKIFDQQQNIQIFKNKIETQQNKDEKGNQQKISEKQNFQDQSEFQIKKFVQNNNNNNNENHYQNLKQNDQNQEKYTPSSGLLTLSLSETQSPEQNLVEIEEYKISEDLSLRKQKSFENEQFYYKQNDQFYQNQNDFNLISQIRVQSSPRKQQKQFKFESDTKQQNNESSQIYKELIMRQESNFSPISIQKQISKNQQNKQMKQVVSCPDLLEFFDTKKNEFLQNNSQNFENNNLKHQQQQQQSQQPQSRIRNHNKNSNYTQKEEEIYDSLFFNCYEFIIDFIIENKCRELKGQQKIHRKNSTD